ncbi:RNA polymerase [Thamnocephalis sphaerospora]|uniref:DNA-directed RNA polymerases I, II, and III subunit RPABC3 n=1 Tax=Thamnocephalis sphaerospora TaxID=78915 RepID=A0A4P9XUM4_9FUNG|nr:RNA polymerase [Thamnocephalis sphaerospora]|eukprot:RKP09916.1 RNA polymerase [Thamnocephalis sphaerospora]
MSGKENVLFSDVFDVKDVDRDGKKFDRVSRINARSENYDMEMTLDVNSELYPMEIGDKFAFALASSLSLEKQAATGDDAEKTEESWRDLSRRNEPTLADSYEYVMHGRVFKYDEGNGTRVAVYVSFGGLLLCLEGDYRHLQKVMIGETVYLLMRK